MGRAGFTLPQLFGSKTGKGPLSDLDSNFTPLKNAILDSGNGFGNWGTVGGTVNAITLTNTPPATSLAPGSTFSFNQPLSSSNTGPATLNVDSLGAASIVNNLGNALVGGEIGGITTVIYDGTKFWLARSYGVNGGYHFPIIQIISGSLPATTLNTNLALPIQSATWLRGAGSITSASNQITCSQDGWLNLTLQADRVVSYSRLLVTTPHSTWVQDQGGQVAVSICLPLFRGETNTLFVATGTAANFSFVGQVCLPA